MSLSQIETFRSWARDKKVLKIEPTETPTRIETPTNTALNSKQRQFIKWRNRSGMVKR